MPKILFYYRFLRIRKITFFSGLFQYIDTGLSFWLMYFF